MQNYLVALLVSVVIVNVVIAQNFGPVPQRAMIPGATQVCFLLLNKKNNFKKKCLISLYNFNFTFYLFCKKI